MSDYPRMMFHRTRQAVIVRNEAEEAHLGPEWSRTWDPERYQLPAPDLHMPAPGSEWARKVYPPEPEPEEPRDPPDEEEEGEQPDDLEFDDPVKKPAHDEAPVSRRAPSRRRKK